MVLIGKLKNSMQTLTRILPLQDKTIKYKGTVDLTQGKCEKLHEDVSILTSVNRYYAFLTMWRDSLNPGSKFKFDQLLVDWWITAFGDKPPIEIKRRDLLIVLGYELLYQGYEATSTTMSEKFVKNYEASKLLLTDKETAVARFSQTSKTLFHIEEMFQDFLNEPLNYKRKEDIMSTAKKNPQAPATEATAKKEKAAPKMSELMQFFYDKLVEGKMTDEQIAIAAKAQFGASYNGNPGYIVICRQNIGKGKYGEAIQLERLIDYKGKVVPISEVPEDEFEAVIREAKKSLKGDKPSPANGASTPKAVAAPVRKPIGQQISEATTAKTPMRRKA